MFFDSSVKVIYESWVRLRMNQIKSNFGVIRFDLIRSVLDSIRFEVKKTEFDSIRFESNWIPNFFSVTLNLY